MTYTFFQTTNEQAFDQWVKTIAIELIRQTPLEAVKYLDIFTLANCWKRKSLVPDQNSNYLPPVVAPSTCEPLAQQNDAHDIEMLLRKCQNAENYVPVKEKLLLFESLCKLGRKVRSTEDVSCKKGETAGNVKARSMHDLSHLQSQKAVRDICRYFEVKSGGDVGGCKFGTIARLNHSDSYLNSVKKTTF